MKKTLYAAYGSNLNKMQMKFRCPTARLRGTGVIRDYELQFKGRPNSAFATIAPKKGASVPVALWELKPSDELSLDRYEGYPSHYFKENIPVEIDGKNVNAMVYLMNLRMDYGLPSAYYYRTVHDGYKDCGLDTSVLERAVRSSADRFYTSAAKRSCQQSIFDHDGVGYKFDNSDDPDEGQDENPDDDLDDEPDESDPFYCPGMS